MYLFDSQSLRQVGKDAALADTRGFAGLMSTPKWFAKVDQNQVDPLIFP